ncbi:hypothetical protein LOTGIDRAFT_133932 [Lottia gigantea]|uniref:Uncharacterized protein n=1 Tax=Lottia gigantea TaxID=225164 RepID=V3ZL64_LOTGI|nr:hypothetical protein LOTGIDRAFT_133932 [Lottia gigantea]ESO83145.1 hypothetical protein LOTGIDRAFT_133932 [Lottia gigantea]
MQYFIFSVYFSLLSVSLLTCHLINIEFLVLFQTVGDTSAAQASGGQNGPQIWERPWSVDEIRKSAYNWTLAGDAGLLQHLQEFSQRIISRTHEIEKSVEGLVHEAKLTDVRVNNVFNGFMMLANTQFVENRVYDEDVNAMEKKQDEQKKDQEKTREEREAELIPKVTAALKYGVDVIDQAFEALDTNVANSDSEDDEDVNYRVDPILEAKDPYVTRPMPCLIGGPDFLQDDNVGLTEYESGKSI